MIDILKLVYGAVSTKDIVPVLTHFCLYKDLIQTTGRIQGGNGTHCIDGPFDHDVPQVSVKADRFLKAVEACEGAPNFGITPAGKLSVKHDRFRAYLPVLPQQDYPRMAQEGSNVPVDPDFIAVLRRLKPFISEDASRVWSTALLFTERYVYATNNIIIVRCPIDWSDVQVAVPATTVDRIIEIADTPSQIFLADNSVTFEYDDVWMRSQLVNEPWPDVERFFTAPFGDLPAVPPDLRKAVERIRVFCANEKFPTIQLGTTLKTDAGEQSAEYDGFDLPDSKFHADQLLKVLSVATHVDFSAFPKPCPFKGNNIEGLFVGLALGTQSRDPKDSTS